ncbi:MAG: acyl-ACP--UDP-N-acetylglucosamine O-acyltransferase [Planctomycetota bacterium]
MATIHPTAIIDPSARIDGSVEIGPYCVIGPDVSIGAGSLLHSHVTIERSTTIGSENEIFPFSVIGATPQDRKFKGETSICTIGDRNLIREHVTVHRGTANGGGTTTIGSDNLIMVAAHIAHDCIVDDHVIIANQVMLAGHVTVRGGANIGGGAGVHHFATVGECAFVGGLARITKDVPPFMIVEGHPAEVRAVNTLAMTRHGYSPEDIDAVKCAYKRLYRDNGSTMSERLVEVREKNVDVPAVVHLCDFITAASDGVHGRASEGNRTDNKYRAIAGTTDAASLSPAAVTTSK